MKRNFLSLIVLVSMLLGLVSSVAASPVPLESMQQPLDQSLSQSLVTKVYYSSQEDLNNLASHYDILEVDKEQGFAYLLLSSTEYSALEQAGYRLEVDQAKTKLLTQPREALPGQGIDTIPGYPCYRTVEETYTSMEQIVTDYPDMAQLYDIGDSWTRIHSGFPNGYDLMALRLSNEDPQFGEMADKPTFFLMAEIHARELVTAEAAMRYAELLVNSYGIDPDITWLLDYFKVYIVTMTNPDGRKKAEAGQLWRKNVDNDDGCNDPYSWGTDLNRNHTFKWNHGGSDSYPCSEVYMGPSAGSEPEVQAIETFVRSIFPDQRGPGDNDPAPADTTGILITLHSYSELVLWPWGWSPAPAPNSTQLQTLGRHLSFFNGYTPQQSYQLYQTSGTSDEFAYGELGIAGYTFEMGTEFFQDCGSFESTVYPDNRDALLYAFKTARQPYMDPAGPDSLNVAVTPGAVVPGEPVQLTATANDTRYGGYGEPTQNINEARYSLDSPSWITDTVTYPMAPADGNFNSNIENIVASVDTTGLSNGRHTIFVESKDANGNWGVTSSAFLYIVEPGVSPVIEGYIREAGTNLPLAANVTAGLFNSTTDPATGYYSMTVISGTYDMVAESGGFAPAYADGVLAENYQTIEQDFLLYPYCTVFTDDVESGNIGWMAQSPWGITTQYAHSPTHSWTDSPAGNYGNYLNISLTSPVFDFSDYTGVSLIFWHRYSTEAGWDYGYVEYSTDGTNWSTLESYDGVQNNWSQVDLSIPGLDGQSTGYVRFHFTSDSNTVADGWYLDDIAISGGGPSCVELLAPQADFTSNSPVELGQPVEFTNTTIGTAPLTYEWTFGDGVGTSTETNPAYTYEMTGTYIVTLAATNPYGNSTITHTVEVETVDFTGVDLTQVTSGPLFPGDLVEFSADLLPDNATKPYTFTIDYGDGTVQSFVSNLDPIPLSHVYDSGGHYTLQISVQNDGMTEPVFDSLDIFIGYKLFLPTTTK
ncbi:MAG: M14 family zinc carboxypeptidase [Anaerolineales bacterium]